MRFWAYMIKAMWRTTRGRWYIWRDTPTDVVRKAAALWFVVRRDKEADEALVSTISQARSEAKLRKKNA